MAIPTALVTDVSQPGQLELFLVCRALTGKDGDELSTLMSHFDGDDAAMMLALGEALRTAEPSTSAAAVRSMLRFLRDNVGMVPLDHVRWHTNLCAVCA